MTNADLKHFRELADLMRAESADWQWIGPHLSQRMFGITRERAEGFAARFGGAARPMDTGDEPVSRSIVRRIKIQKGE